jgi:hypothetical protein
MAHNTPRDGAKDPACEERATLLSGHAELVELPVGEEAETLRGQFGDGPVEVTGHGEPG